jgi:4'-phosphopantetheinyl transferase
MTPEDPPVDRTTTVTATTIVWHSHGEADTPEALDWLTPREAARALGMHYAKRRNEFLLSRWTTKTALAHRLGLRADVTTFVRLEVGNAADGAPEALLDGRAVPVALSMTDRAGWAICALADAGTAIGCDLELVEPRSAAFVADYFTPAEQQIVAAAHQDDRHRLANLIWSAKESALKVLRTGLRRDTRSVEVALDGGPLPHGWAVLRVRTAEGRTFLGWWRRYGSFLVTIAADVTVAPPLALREPPGIAQGVPTHTWMHTLR